MIKNMEYRDSDDDYCVIIPLIYLEESDDEEENIPPGQLKGTCEAPSDPPSVGPTSEPGPRS